MPLLIDGYNLLNVAGILTRGVGPGTLQRARLAMLNFLAESLPPEEIRRTTVVFDAQDPPPGLPRTLNHRGLTVRFALADEEADDLIERLILEHSAPRRLTVVSSDHRLQRAAHRRRARAIDSDLWYAEVVRGRQERHQATKPSARPAVPLLSEDVEYWLRQFGGESALQALIDEESRKPAPKTKESPDDKPEIENPFPPGYGEDLSLDDE